MADIVPSGDQCAPASSLRQICAASEPLTPPPQWLSVVAKSVVPLAGAARPWRQCCPAFSPWSANCQVAPSSLLITSSLAVILAVEPGITASELVMSSDDGATWQFADQGLNAGQHCLQGLAAPASGTTLFATTLSHCGGGVSGSEAAQIWRSDDAGAHWSPEGTMSAMGPLN